MGMRAHIYIYTHTQKGGRLTPNKKSRIYCVEIILLGMQNSKYYQYLTAVSAFISSIDKRGRPCESSRETRASRKSLASLLLLCL